MKNSDDRNLTLRKRKPLILMNPSLCFTKLQPSSGRPLEAITNCLKTEYLARHEQLTTMSSRREMFSCEKNQTRPNVLHTALKPQNVTRSISKNEIETFSVFLRKKDFDERDETAPPASLFSLQLFSKKPVTQNLQILFCEIHTKTQNAEILFHEIHTKTIAFYTPFKAAPIFPSSLPMCEKHMLEPSQNEHNHNPEALATARLVKLLPRQWF